MLIYLHIYANIVALGVQIALLSLHPYKVSLAVHSRLAWMYTISVTSGTVSSIFYASHQDYGSDAGKSGTVAFGAMAFATLATLATSLYYGYVHRDAVLHREWSIRNFAILFGNGVIFRLLANTYLPCMTRWGADFYASWCQMIYLSWFGPLFVAEQYLAWEKSVRREEHVMTKTDSDLAESVVKASFHEAK